MFLERLSHLSASPRGESALLCLCMHLLLQRPSLKTAGDLKLLYATAQSLVNHSEQVEGPSLTHSYTVGSFLPSLRLVRVNRLKHIYQLRYASRWPV